MNKFEKLIKEYSTKKLKEIIKTSKEKKNIKIDLDSSFLYFIKEIEDEKLKKLKEIFEISAGNKNIKIYFHDHFLKKIYIIKNDRLDDETIFKKRKIFFVRND